MCGISAIFLEQRADRGAGGSDLNHDWSAQRLCPRQVAIPWQRTDVWRSAVWLFHPVPGDFVAYGTVAGGIGVGQHGTGFGVGPRDLWRGLYHLVFPQFLCGGAHRTGAGRAVGRRRILCDFSAHLFARVVTDFHGHADLAVHSNLERFLVWRGVFGAGYAAITVALNNLVNTSVGGKEYNVDMAAALIAAAPTLVIYVVAGKYFVRGLTAGAVKG